MARYIVRVSEMLVRDEEVEAENPEEAVQKVKDLYRDEEIILTGDDFNGETKFEIADE